MADDEQQNDQPQEGQEPEGQDTDAGSGPIEPEVEEAVAEESGKAESGGEDAPAEDAPAAEAEEAAPAEQAPPAEAASEDAPAEEEAPRAKKRGKKSDEKKSEDVIPGAHLEPDLVLEEARSAGEGDQYAEAGAEYADEEGAPAEAAAEGDEAEQPVAHEPLDLAADARYTATGKRKSAVARVILRPGGGSYTVNGRHLDQFFPRVKLQRMAQQPLETAGYDTRIDVVAKIHGGGVSSQAGALRHGIARALVEADPNLRTELKRRGFLTRDPRVKERKKAGLKKARKRPQFSKR
jgi:small subunit ribosomal protein S9